MGGLWTLCHVGTLIVSQWRYAFSRHSSSHSGSFFFEEIRRMVSSFSPGGATSCSISVTKPHLYSRLTRASIALVGVLMASPLRCCLELWCWPPSGAATLTSRPGAPPPADTLLPLHVRSHHGMHPGVGPGGAV